MTAPGAKTVLELAEAGLRHAEGLSAQLAKPDWKPSRSHIEQARNSIQKLAGLLRVPDVTVATREPYEGSGDTGVADHPLLKKAYAALPSEAIGRDQVIAQCAIIALEQRCERGTPWDLACTTIAEKIRALLVSRPNGNTP